MRAIIFLTASFLAGCSHIPIEQVNDRLQEWKGEHIDKVISLWGLPTKKTDINGKHYAEWLNEENSSGNTAIGIGGGSRGRNSGIGIGLTLLDLGGSSDTCSRSLVYNDLGFVTQVTWKGSQEFCYELTPKRR